MYFITVFGCITTVLLQENGKKRSVYGNRGLGTPAADSEKKAILILESRVTEHIFKDLICENEISVDQNEYE